MSPLYQIRIKGHLDPSWAEWFGTMSLSHQEDGTTLLTGPVADQPALHGLLAKLHSLGLSLLLVERIDSEEAE
jgi:hypothetical protein